MSSDNLFDAAVEDLDFDLTPQQGNTSTRVSSTVTSASSAETQTRHEVFNVPALPVEASSLFICPHDGCSKTYKTKAFFKKHIFLHEISDFNSRKPELEFVAAAVDDLVVNIFEEMKHEPIPCDEKIKILNAALESRGSIEWMSFTAAISDPILSAVTERSQLLPSNQYEVFLSELNHNLNNNEFMEERKFELLLVLSRAIRLDPSIEHSRFIGVICSRLIMRLGEEIQLLVTKEMSKRSEQDMSDPDDPGSSPLTEVEKKLFAGKVASICRSYYNKAITKDNLVLMKRCECMKAKFIECCGSSVHSKDIMSKEAWVLGSLFPSETLLSFCHDVELLLESSEPTVDCNSLCKKNLFEPHNLPVLQKWHSLTDGYLGDIDSVSFMHDFVYIMYNVSHLLKVRRLKDLEASNRKLQKFGVRDNLKRN